MILRAALWSALVLAAAFGLYGIRPPAALGPEAPLEQFSAARAVSHLASIAARPHPIGSPANDEVRAYLVATLRSLGASVRIEQTIGRQQRKGVVREKEVRNIVATLPGTHNHRAVMLVAHYDSVPAGPGAADDGAGLISILESLRAIRAGQPLQNDLLLLLTDGEETGLLGAAGFVADHPELARQVALAINLEARGSSGPALMFETSDQNGWLVPEFGRAAPYPVASSLMYSFYKLMPNDTDLTELKKTGVAALNFAFTEKVRNYHSPNDTVANLDPRSVQQMGMNALALVRHFGQMPLTELRKPDCIYFNWIGSRLVVYPLGIAWLLAVVTFALLIMVFWLGRRNGSLRLSWASFGAFFLLLLSVSAGMLLAWFPLQLVVGKSFGMGDSLGNRLFLAGLVALGFACGILVLRWLSRRIGSRDLSAGLLLVTALLAALVLYLLPGASYLLQWPALLGTASLLLSRLARTSAGRAGGACLSVLPAMLLLSPLANLFFVNLGLNLISLAAIALLLSLLFASGWPLFDFLVRRDPAAQR